MIPCFNRSRAVADAVASVLAQSPAPVGVTVVDDASSDGSAAVLRALASRYPTVLPLLLPRNGGVSAARNVGIAAGTAAWIGFVDDDDIWLPGAAAAMLSAAATGAYDVVVGHFARVAQGAAPGPAECGWDGGDIRAALRGGGVVGTSWSLVRRTGVEAVGGFDPTFRTCEDWDFFTRLAAAGARFGRIDTVVAHYRTVPGARMIADPTLAANEARARAHPFLA